MRVLDPPHFAAFTHQIARHFAAGIMPKHVHRVGVNLDGERMDHRVQSTARSIPSAAPNLAARPPPFFYEISTIFPWESPSITNRCARAASANGSVISI